MGNGKTQQYYDANPAANKRRIAQQKRYNKKGSSKPGTKDITGNDIAKNAVALNHKLGTYGNGDNLDAAHYKGSTTRGRSQHESINRGEPHKNKKKNKNKLYITT